jgi:hypothetical protein
MPGESAPNGGECPLCHNEYCTALTPNGSGVPKLSAVKDMDVCIRGAWVFLHSGDVPVRILENWQIHRNQHHDANYSFVGKLSAEDDDA